MNDDTISRAAAIDALDKRFDSIPMEQTAEILQLRKDLRELPSAQPERIKGRWIDDGLYSDNFPHHAWHCSECEESVLEIDEPWFKFCPNCGADMREVDDERPD